MSDSIKFKTAGFSATEDLTFYAGVSKCGDIEDGVAFSHDRNGAWVVRYCDLMAMAAAATAVRLKPAQADDAVAGDSRVNADSAIRA